MTTLNLIEFRKVKSTFHSEYKIEKDGSYVGYAYRCFPSSAYRVVIWQGSHQTEYKNIQPVKKFVKGLM